MQEGDGLLCKVRDDNIMRRAVRKELCVYNHSSLLPYCFPRYRYEDDELFLLVALTAVYTMAENQKENQSRLLEGDGAKILLKTLKKHEDFQDIISVGLDVIFALTYDSHDGPSTLSHPILREAGSCEFILKMLEDYPRCPEIYGPGLKAMACLLTSAENQATMTGPAWCKVVTEVGRLVPK